MSQNSGLLRLPPADARSISASTASRGDTPALEHCGHLRGDRQLDAVPRAERQRRAGRAHAFGDHLHVCREMSASERPRPSSMPTWRLRLRSPVHVSTQIAEAAQAGQRLAPAALGARQPGDLGEAARDQRRQRVVPETEPFDHAGGNRDDVLQRAADLDAATSSLAYRRNVGPAELLLDARRGRGSRDAASTAVGSPRATSTAKLGPRARRRDRGRRPPPQSPPTCAQRVRLEPLRRADDDRVAAEKSGSGSKHGAQAVRRNRGDHEVRRRSAPLA